MKKLFFVLLALCFAGAAGLLWLMRTAPVPPPPATAEQSAGVTVPTTPLADESPTSEQEPEHEEAPETVASAAPSAPRGIQPGELSLSTEPIDAEVFVDGKSRGRTPLRLPLQPDMKKIELVAEGFETYTREVPADADIGALAWKVQLKPMRGAHMTPPSRAGATAARADSKATPTKQNQKLAENPELNYKTYLRGDLGRWFVQLKSFPRDGTVPEDALLQSVKDFRRLSAHNVQACKVDLMAKGQWTRLLIGPFETKGQASQLASKLKNQLPDGAIVVGAQSCLP